MRQVVASVLKAVLMIFGMSVCVSCSSRVGKNLTAVNSQSKFPPSEQVFLEPQVLPQNEDTRPEDPPVDSMPDLDPPDSLEMLKSDLEVVLRSNRFSIERRNFRLEVTLRDNVFGLRKALPLANDVTFDCGGGTLIAAPGSGAFAIHAKRNITIQNCDLKGHGAQDGYSSVKESMIIIGSLGNARSENVQLKNIEIEEIRGQAGIKMYNVKDIRVEEVRVSHYSYAGIQILGASERVRVSRTVVEHSHARNGSDLPETFPFPEIRGMAYGFQVSSYAFESEAHAFPKGVIVENCKCINNPTWDCYDAHGGSDLYFFGNVAENSLKCFDINTMGLGDREFKNIYLVGNSCTGTGVDAGNSRYSQGILVGGTSNAIAKSVVVSNNLVVGGTAVKEIPRAGITVQHAEGVVLSGNSVHYGLNMGIMLNAVSGFQLSQNNVFEVQGSGFYLIGGVNDGRILQNRVISPSRKTRTGINLRGAAQNLTGRNWLCVDQPFLGGAVLETIGLLPCDKMER